MQFSFRSLGETFLNRALPASRAATRRVHRGGYKVQRISKLPEATAADSDLPGAKSESDPLAVTSDGQTWFSSQVAGHPKRREIEAHEAVHRAQFALNWREPNASRTELEREADLGAAALVANRPFVSRLSAQLGTALAFPAPAAWVETNLSNEEREKLRAFGPDAYESSVKVLDQILRRIKSPNRSGGGRQQIQTRAGAGELRAFIFLIRSSNVVALRLIPSGRGGRSPDVYVRFNDGSEGRIEITTMTQSERGVRHSTVEDRKGQARQRVPKDSSGRIILKNTSVTPRQIEAAIRQKVWPSTGESQLTAKAKKAQLGAKAMVARGIVVVEITQARIDRAELDKTLMRLQKELGKEPFVTAIWIHARLAGDEVRTMSKYERSNNFAPAAREKVPRRRAATEQRPQYTTARSQAKSEVHVIVAEGPTTEYIGENPIKRVGEPGFVDTHRGSVSLPRPTGLRVGAGAGAALVVLELFSWYATLDESQLSRALSAYRNSLFRKMGGDRHEFLTHTVYTPPIGEALIRWLGNNLRTWRDFHRFWNKDARGILLRTESGWVLRVGKDKDDEPVSQPIDAEVQWLFAEINRRTVLDSVAEILSGSGLARFKPSTDSGGHKVWRHEDRGLPQHLIALADASVLPANAQFFVRGESNNWRGLRIGTFVIVEGADPETVRAMRGQAGLIDPEYLENVPSE